MDRLTKPAFNADDAEEYFSMQLGYYRTCQKDIFNRDNQNRDSNNFVYSAEYQKYLGMEIAMREVLNYFAKYELSCEMKLQPLIPQQIVEMQNHLAEAMELLELAKSDIEDLKDCHHCNFNPLENCPGCDQYGENWKWQYADRYEELKQSTDINVGNINEVTQND